MFYFSLQMESIHDAGESAQSARYTEQTCIRLMQPTARGNTNMDHYTLVKKK